ncbi:MAG TPA: carboxymuconolactone decarboxylase family protein [Acetobacteraceae bacterium]|jgi:AhpD family alkylhydroperoxidase|nr:carboxymuconolactone decarboxylase family protein [Acetobacteraceae bacterium]
MHKARIDALKVIPDAYAAVRGVEGYLRKCGLEKSLYELVKIRASQINQCAFCLDMHCRDARAGGETEQRLYVLAGWRDSPLFTKRERAALAWTECLTRLSIDGAPDDVYAALKEEFTDTEIGNLTVLIGQINLWNRISVGLSAQHPVVA